MKEFFVDVSGMKKFAKNVVFKDFSWSLFQFLLRVEQDDEKVTVFVYFVKERSLIHERQNLIYILLRG
jgi:hypothetical protein